MIASGILISASTYLLAFTVKLSMKSSWLLNDTNSFQRSFDNVFENIIYITGLIYGTSDIFLVMYLANEIRLTSDRLSYCVFESNWIEQPQSKRKLVILLSEFLKKPQEMVIFKLYTMNLETFTMVSL